jgi:adenosylmethionine-8-amino-7-oxononanoate aminotransferase
MHALARLDHAHVWHPFTQMRDWLRREPLVITSGRGAVLRDVHGHQYLDANSSIWTNLHGHKHPTMDAALRRQLKQIAHSSALGLANGPAADLAAQLVAAANPGSPRKTRPQLGKVFFSDDGSTAVEVALKLAYEFCRRSGRSRNPQFLSLDSAYHGDTLGAVSLGHLDLFHQRFSGLLFKSAKVMAPGCYRCPFNRAKPERADAREYRRCNWECIGKLESKFESAKKRRNPISAFVFEPLIQGAAGMIAHPAGWLRRASEIARGHGALLIADEVMTGFGRTGTGPSQRPAVRGQAGIGLFACQHEGVQPDFLALAKGLTGGYLPMAATLTTQKIFAAFLGKHSEYKTFFHGHSYTGNQLGAAAALASLEILATPSSLRNRQVLERSLHQELSALWIRPNVGDVRQVGLVAGVELVSHWRTREPFPPAKQIGIKVCQAMARRGVLTRPIGNVIVLMPPYCTTPRQLRRMTAALGDSVQEVCG